MYIISHFRWVWDKQVNQKEAVVKYVSLLVGSSDLMLKTANEWAILISFFHVKSCSTTQRIWENCDTWVNSYPFSMNCILFFFLLALQIVIYLYVIWKIQSAPPCREGAKDQMLRHDLGRRMCWRTAMHSIFPGTSHLFFISTNESRK